MWSTELPKSTILAAKSVHHNLYDHAKSHTFEPSSGQTWNITYGDGSSASGNVGTDVVNIGGIQIANQAVEMAKKLSPSFEQQEGDGLMGLAFVCWLIRYLVDVTANDYIEPDQYCPASTCEDASREHDRAVENQA